MTAPPHPDSPVPWQLANTLPAAFWTLFHILNDPTAEAGVRAELEADGGVGMEETLERLRNGSDRSAGRQQQSVVIDRPHDTGSYDERLHHHVPRGDGAQDSQLNESRFDSVNSALSVQGGSIGDHLRSIGDRLSTLRNDVSGPGSQT